jgi:hypothetical protein
LVVRRVTMRAAVTMRAVGTWSWLTAAVKGAGVMHSEPRRAMAARMAEAPAAAATGVMGGAGGALGRIGVISAVGVAMGRWGLGVEVKAAVAKARGMYNGSVKASRSGRLRGGAMGGGMSLAGKCMASVLD